MSVLDLDELLVNHQTVPTAEVEIYEAQHPVNLQRWWAALDPAWQIIFRQALPLADPPSEAQLEALTNLDRLNCSGVDDLSPLIRLKKLKSLDCGRLEAITLDPLRHLSHLEVLKFRGPIASLYPLRHLKRLRILEFGKYVNSLEPLYNLDRLQELRSDFGSHVERLEPIAHLTGLKILRLDTFYQGLELSHLSRLTNPCIRAAERKAYEEQHPDCKVW